MRKNTLLVALLVGLGTFALSAFSEMSLIADIRPGTLLLGAETGDFQAIGTAPHAPTITEIEEAGSVSSFPNVKLGISLERPRSFLDITGQMGILVNERIRSFFYGADVAFEYRIRKNVSIGPHLGLISFPDPEWTGDASVDFSDTVGWLGGVQMTLGYDIIFVFAIDYMSVSPMDVETSGSWTTSDDELDLSGFAIQFGMKGRF